MRYEDYERLHKGDIVKVRKTGLVTIVEDIKQDQIITEDGQSYPYRSLTRVPPQFYAFNSIYGYEFSCKRWIYDCKYYLKKGMWYNIHNNSPAMPLEEYMVEQMKCIIKEHPERSFDTTQMVI